MKDVNSKFEINQKRWNELVSLNANSKFYDLKGFKSGNTSLLPIEIEELGNVQGKSLLHLQCHFGMDSLSWARKGVLVTGVDFSSEAIQLARQLSKELKISAKFIESNIYDLPKHIDQKFDIVFTSYGVLCWLPNLFKWAEIIDYCLKPGGCFYIIESHPFGFLIDENFKEDFRIGYNYFNYGKAYRFDDGISYATSKKLKNQTSWEWVHTMGEIINSLISADLTIEFLHEFPFTFFQMHPDLKQREDKYWEFQNFKYNVPMMFSLKAWKRFV